jgi:hypothetical protein
MKIVKGVVWRVNRLRCMAPEEIRHRVLRAQAMRAERWRLVGSSAVPPPDLADAFRPWIHAPVKVDAARYLAAAERIAAGRPLRQHLADPRLGIEAVSTRNSRPRPSPGGRESRAKLFFAVKSPADLDRVFRRNHIGIVDGWIDFHGPYFLMPSARIPKIAHHVARSEGPSGAAGEPGTAGGGQRGFLPRSADGCGRCH